MVDTLPLLYYIGVAVLGALEAIALIAWPYLLATSSAVKCKGATIVQQPRVKSLFGFARQETTTAVILEEGPSAPYMREKIVAGYNKRLSAMVLLFAIALGLELTAIVALIWGQGVFLNGADVAQPLVFLFVAGAFVYNLGVYLGFYAPVRIAAALCALISFAIVGASSFFAVPTSWYYWAAHAVWFVAMALMVFISSVASCTQTTVALLALLALAAHSVIWLFGPSALQSFSLELWSGLWMLGVALIAIFQLCLLATFWSAYTCRKRREQMKQQ